MNDCVNAEIRDRLPDLLHERLDPAVRVAVMAHVDGCADCRAELALLRDMHAMLTNAGPRVDVGRIVQALPRRRAARSRWVSWRAAAAAALIIVGGSSLLLVDRGGQTVARDSSVAAARTEKPTATAPPMVPNREGAASTPAVTKSMPAAGQQVAHATDVSGETGIEMTGRLGELTDDELRLLLQEIDELEAVPLTEPEPVVIPITSKRPASPVGT